jgi:hypothetical protein
VGKPEDNRPLERPRRRWLNNIKIELRGRGWGDMDWIDVVQDRNQWRVLVNTAMNLLVPCSAGKFLSSCTTGGLSRRAQLHAPWRELFSWSARAPPVLDLFRRRTA